MLTVITTHLSDSYLNVAEAALSSCNEIMSPSDNFVFIRTRHRSLILSLFPMLLVVPLPYCHPAFTLETFST